MPPRPAPLFKSIANPAPRTIQLELSGGGAHGAYECGALEILVPYWKEKGFTIQVVTGVSAGAVNAVLLSYAHNSNLDVTKTMDGFWDKIAAKGDLYLKPLLDFHAAANFLNPFENPSNKFPNIPHHLMVAMKLAGKSSIPLDQLKSQLIDYIPPEGWEAIRTGETKTFIETLAVDEKIGTRTPVIFSQQDISPETILASAALRDFAPYRLNGQLYEDGGYDKIGFFMKDCKADVLFAIGLKPLRDATEFEDHRGVKTGQLHHDLARYYLDPKRTCHIDFICMDHPAYWNETSAMNNTSKNIRHLREMGRTSARAWIEQHGKDFGKKSSFEPSDLLLNVVDPSRFPTLAAA